MPLLLILTCACKDLATDTMLELKKNVLNFEFWDVLEVNWNDVHVTLNEREINLPMSLVIPIAYKINTRQLFKKRDYAPIHHVETKEILVQLREHRS